MLRRRLIAVVLVVTGTLLFFAWNPEPRFTPRRPEIQVSERARTLHQEALVVDMHIDSFLWPRDITRSGQGGQFDLERMHDGGLDVAGFAMPTAFFGLAGLKAFHDRWPRATWFSRWARLKHQLERMKSVTALQLATTADELRRLHKSGTPATFRSVEGAHAIENDVSRVAELAADGILFLGVVHLSNNDFGGSSSGSDRALTPLGEELIDAMNRAGVLVDLAHASPTTFDDALARTELPPVVSHSGVRAVHDTWRNLTNSQLRAVADRGGVIGIMLTPPALSEASLEEAVRHIEHAVDVAGEDAVAIGSDFDGYVVPPIDVSGLPQLTELMLRLGFSESRIRKILGGNFVDLLRRRDIVTGRKTNVPPAR